MTLNLDDVLDEPALGQRSPQTSDSVAGAVDKSHLLEFLAQMESETKQDALAVAHDEDISAWMGAIAHWLEEHQSQDVSLLELQRSLQLPFIELWLALLLGGYVMEQRGDFYQIEGVWVKA